MNGAGAFSFLISAGISRFIAGIAIVGYDLTIVAKVGAGGEVDNYFRIIGVVMALSGAVANALSSIHSTEIAAAISQRDQNVNGIVTARFSNVFGIAALSALISVPVLLAACFFQSCKAGSEYGLAGAMALLIITGSLCSTFSAVLGNLGHGFISGLPRAIPPVIGLVAIYSLVEPRVTNLFLLAIFAALVEFIVFYSVFRNNFRAVTSRGVQLLTALKPNKEQAKSFITLIVGTFCFSFIPVVDLWMVGLAYDGAVSVYAVASRLPVLASTFLSLVTAVFFGRLAILSLDRPDGNVEIRRWLVKFAICAIVATPVFGYVGYLIFEYLLSDLYRKGLGAHLGVATWIHTIHACQIPAAALLAGTGRLLVARSKFRPLSLIAFGALAVTLVTDLAFVKLFGAVGIPIASISVTVVMLVVQISFTLNSYRNIK